MTHQQMVDSIKIILKEQNFKVFQYDDTNEDYKTITFITRLNCKYDFALIEIALINTSFNVFIHCKDKVPSKNRFETARYITYANFCIKNGNFELNLKDGEVRYKTYVDMSEEEGKPTLTVMRAILMAAKIFNMYGTGLYNVANGIQNAQAAIYQAEHN